ncbi:DUF389 domain-containing protein [Leptospira sp. 96542]|nr:DUF389 domain-containing protein [Leptospira sp. 96542]
MNKNNPIINFFSWVLPRFNLFEDLDKQGTIESIQKGAEIKGTNLWTLIFAIFIASIGLNVNSTAVIIGAMLISPLMGPIVGIGFAAATNDFDELKRYLRVLAVATFASILTSFIYFSLSPISEAQSELLARTSPTIYDALIALFGGATGIIANTRKEKGNAIAGVAIATALMPPLCTAGYGLSQGNWQYFLGATYLYLINSIFIAIATFIFVRYLEFPKVDWGLYKEREKKVKVYLAIFSLIVLLPSVYTATQIVRSSYFKAKTNEFIKAEIVTPTRKILDKTIEFGSPSKIELSLIGPRISDGDIEDLKSKLKLYGIANSELILHQDFSAPNADNIKYEVLAEIYQNQMESKKIDEPQLAKEISVFFPGLASVSFSKSKRYNVSENVYQEVTMFDTEWTKLPTETEKQKLIDFLRLRIEEEYLELNVRKVKPSS